MRGGVAGASGGDSGDRDTGEACLGDAISGDLVRKYSRRSSRYTGL
jgi:hypothetical protein